MKIGRCLYQGKETLFLFSNGKYFSINGKSDINEIIKTGADKIDVGNEISNFQFLPAVNPQKIFLPAVNFRSHSAESDTRFPPKPYFFTKFSNALVANNSELRTPGTIKKLDYEGETGAVIGKKCYNIPAEDAYDCIFGFTIANDLSARDFQFPEMHPYGYNWVQGKAFDGALPVGPYITTKDEIQFPLEIETKVNGETRQKGTTDDMVFSFQDLISTLSQNITLEPGDIITSGTPAGVAAFSEKLYLKSGDVIEISVSSLGTLMNKIL
ncbi:2-hydroxyhepta-2,4-diend-1,7-dioate isomerase [Thermoplasma volcanium GSS1]|uniref:2-hydroxyhepta-2,4-diend-1,7-dioate isomerase n=1 Tax=Thermoplasma volcanium (strain ATCC 51530 / DSM 4299 / JCM 9571 / NBRC 15438 / GSS1) TaxID=273116 RepID=Q979A6_THEVO|nr:fumarylacetoacetate hydrolase family protein [Thermoplasma volcanium]BAB60398.1 2-hydroxyhepta-2,4-diend-1,7-dioate isomerase [Thermoplasma volcanium GSS1]